MPNISYQLKENTISKDLIEHTRDNFITKPQVDQANILNRIFSWNKEAYEFLKQKLRLDNTTGEDSRRKLVELNSKLIDLSKKVKEEGIKDEAAYKRKLVEDERVIQQNKINFNTYRPKMPDESTTKISDELCKAYVVDNLLSLPPISTQLNIKIPNFNFNTKKEGYLKELEKLLDNLHQIGIADNYKLIVTNLYEIDKIDKLDKHRSMLLSFPRADGSTMINSGGVFKFIKNLDLYKSIINNLGNIQSVLQLEIDKKFNTGEKITKFHGEKCAILNKDNPDYFHYEEF